jgi:hypothetical protein
MVGTAKSCLRSECACGYGDLYIAGLKVSLRDVRHLQELR